MRDYTQYRWFFTSNNVLVVGGKSAEQNDALLTRIKDTEREHVVMHTSHPGSPFCILIEHPANLSKQDLAECAQFCGCFSRAWKERKKTTNVHMFASEHVHKEKGMKVGTWSVSGEITDFIVELKLVFTKQQGIYRCVPPSVAEGIIIRPGTTDKSKQIDKLRKALKDEKATSDALLSALPPGGVRIIATKSV